jgi:hypothetical protein
MINHQALGLAMGGISMKSALLIAIVLASATSSQTLARDASDSSDRASESFAVTTEFSSATGRPLGSVTKIGGTTYYLGADGTMLGTSTVVEGRRVFKTY